MTVDLSRYDLSNVEARAALDPIPPAWYDAVITETKLRPTAAGDGQLMELVLDVTSGAHKGRKLWDRLNIQNPNQKAMEIAFSTLKSIYDALGVVRVNNSAELHGRPLKVKVTLAPAEVGKDGRNYEAKNEIKGYDSINSNHATASVDTVAGVAGAPQGVPAWAQGQAQPEQPTQPAQPAVNATPATIPSGKQPWETQAAAIPPPNNAALQLTEKAAGLTLEDFRKQNWTDAQLIENGYAVALTPTPSAPVAPGAPAAPPAATGQAGGNVPPWAQ